LGMSCNSWQDDRAGGGKSGVRLGQRTGQKGVNQLLG
jgi:hypothetical protein